MFRIITTRQRTRRTTERVASNTITGGSENLNSGGQTRFDNCARMTFAILKLCQIFSGSVEDDNLQFEILRQLAQMCSRIFERAALSSFDNKSESKWKGTQILVPGYMMSSLSCLVSLSSNVEMFADHNIDNILIAKVHWVDSSAFVVHCLQVNPSDCKIAWSKFCFPAVWSIWLVAGWK